MECKARSPPYSQRCFNGALVLSSDGLKLADEDIVLDQEASPPRRHALRLFVAELLEN